MIKKTPYEVNERNGGIQRIYKFDNGFGASVVTVPFTYGGLQGKYELAVIRFQGDAWEITYDTLITNDVIGHLSPSDVDDLLKKIEKWEPIES